ncbi:MAG: hypothetical protein KDA28_09630, partial [Phycisphaerales bacterium]|nr:hypothetical protein [Phycisphaerales bacterium]
QIAEDHFGIRPDAVERAWARQYGMLTDHVDPRHAPIAPDLLALIDRRQAWQFGVLPLRDAMGELVLCTTEDRLPRAMRFASWRLNHPTSFVLSDEDALSEALAILYPMAGLKAL